MSIWSQMMLQDSNSPLMEQLMYFHDHTILILMVVLTPVSYLLVKSMLNQYINRNLLEEQTIELIWTVLPTLTLIFIALPSLRLLYLLDDTNQPIVSVKSIGHQWFWTYELTDFKNVEFDSYLKPDKSNNQFRLLDVDSRLALPFKTQLQMLVTSTDVIHSWTIPSLAVKMDATPGRLNQLSFSIHRPGILYGQCSEICGMNHSFMPIVIESIKPVNFLHWIQAFSLDGWK
uniref:Cytochrome c oxidase subunit 2 n=1 Tax=Elateroidea sp. BMNH 1274729 TaxID=1796501 RepID=A0A126TGD5_9COLE|nr:cytochrome c oxidase subunit II [Elateroidea sp. BMNH 1274729]